MKKSSVITAVSIAIVAAVIGGVFAFNAYKAKKGAEIIDNFLTESGANQFILYSSVEGTASGEVCINDVAIPQLDVKVKQICLENFKRSDSSISSLSVSLKGYSGDYIKYVGVQSEALKGLGIYNNTIDMRFDYSYSPSERSLNIESEHNLNEIGSFSFEIDFTNVSVSILDNIYMLARSVNLQKIIAGEVSYKERKKTEKLIESQLSPLKDAKISKLQLSVDNRSLIKQLETVKPNSTPESDLYTLFSRSLSKKYTLKEWLAQDFTESQAQLLSMSVKKWLTDDGGKLKLTMDPKKPFTIIDAVATNDGKTFLSNIDIRASVE